MSYFTAKMHQIWFRLGLRPDPAGERLRPLAGFRGRTSIGEWKDQEAVAVLEGARMGAKLGISPPFLFSAF